MSKKHSQVAKNGGGVSKHSKAIRKNERKPAVKQPKFTSKQVAEIRKGYAKASSARVERVRSVIKEKVKRGQTRSFFVIDTSSIQERIELWRTMLPRVEIFYAVKVNPDDEIVKKCIQMGTGFDAASHREIERIIKLGAKPENIIFANPVKSPEQIHGAKANKVKMTTIDTVEELLKLHKHYPAAECVIRIATDQTDAVYNLSEKYGASMEDVPKILETAKKLGVRTKGVAFHTGSGGVGFSAYKSSIRNARKIFDMAQGMGLPEMDLLDIGGGFTMINPTAAKNFEMVAQCIG